MEPHALLALAEQADAELNGPDQLDWLERLESEQDNFRHVLKACKEDAHAAERGLRLCAALARFWWMRGHAVEGLEWIQQFLEQPIGDAGLRARVLEGGGALAYARSDYPRAQGLYEQALALFREQGELRGQSRMLNQLGMVAREQGDAATARALHEESLERYRSLGDPWGQASCQNNLGVVAFLEGNQTAALSHHQRSLELRRQIGDARGIASSLSNLGHLARLAGNFEEARGCYQESLEIRQLLGDRWGVAAGFVSLGGLACEEGDLAQARNRLEQGLSLFHMVGDWVGICESLEGFGMLAAAEQDAGRAARLAAGAEAIRKTLNAPLPCWKRPAWERWQRQLQEKLGEEAYRQAWAAGSGHSGEDSIRLATRS